MTLYGITEDYDYNQTHKRHRLMLWSAPFMSTPEGEALSLPKNNGYMIDTGYDKIRVECPAPRTSDNFREVDEAINKALNEHYDAQLASAFETAAAAVEKPAAAVAAPYRPNGKSVIRKR